MASRDKVLNEYLRQRKLHKEKQLKPSWEDQALHGRYCRQFDEVAVIKKSYHWLEKSGLKDSTEALIMAAQEHALSGRAIDRDLQASKAYKERHNQVACMAHRNICTLYHTTSGLVTRWWRMTELRSYGTSRYRLTSR